MAPALCTARHAIDLDDGRTVAPGEQVSEIDLEHPHNRALVEDGHLIRFDPPPKAKATPSGTQTGGE